ncbi:MAG TPA: hypothetical protein VG984_02675 [Candidatus Paceibacterota bacterium]|nr:hypothetical protein [Candidatus Paceibacterota bacterium]
MEWLQLVVHGNSPWTYLWIFLIGIPEGPILTLVCGSFAADDLLNPLYVYVTVVFGDMVGDTRHYLEGRMMGWFGRISSRWRWAKWLNGRFKLGQHMEKARNHIDQAPFMSFCVFKLTFGLGAAGLITAGAMRFSYLRFVRNCAAVSMIQSFVYLSLGMILGEGVWRLQAHVNGFVLFAGFGLVILGVILAIRWAVTRFLPKAPQYNAGPVV